MATGQDKRTGNWFYRVRVVIDGKPDRVFCAKDENGQPFRKEKHAKEAEKKFLEDLKKPAQGNVPILDDWFFGRYWTEWVLGQPRGANSDGEQESKRLIYNKHLKPFFGALRLDRIDVPLINTFRSQMRAKLKPNGKKAIAEKTLNNILAVLSTPLQYAEKVAILMRAPHVGVAKVERAKIEFIEFEEVPVVVNAAREDMHTWVVLAVLLAYEAGLRIGEIRALEWNTLDMRARSITVVQQVRTVGIPWPAGTTPIDEDGHKRGKYQYVDKMGPPKGRRRRTIPMSPALYELLKDRVPRTGFVVTAEAGKMITKEMVRGADERVKKLAGLKKSVSGWHIGRHTFATHAALLGVNQWFLQEWMGHVSPQETQRYADVARAHGRTIPSELQLAANDVVDPEKRLLAKLSARLDLQPARAKSKKR